MSFTVGDKGESLWYSEIQKTHTNIETAPKRKFYDWDIKATYKGKEITYEVKYDEKGYYYASRHKRPVNLYIEFENTNKEEASGILASKAKYYVYILRSLDRVETAYVFDRLELLAHLQETNYPIKGNKTGGDNNAKGWIPPLDSLRPFLKKKIVLQ